MNRPYISELTNLCNENVYKTEPATFGAQNLLVSHGQQRRTYDTATTSITGNSQVQQQANIFQQNPIMQQQQQPQLIQGQMQVIPEGVTYTFHPQVQNYALKNFDDPRLLYSCTPQQQSLTLQQQIAMNQLEKSALECMLLQEKMRQNPFHLQFHSDGQTDTKDLRSACQCDSKPFPSSLKPISNTIEEAQKIDIYRNADLKPGCFFPDSAKQKRVMFTNESKYDDKSTQHAPEFDTTEMQVNSGVLCTCKATSDDDMHKEYSDAESQTESRRVTFGEEGSRLPKRSSKWRLNLRKTRRAVDDGSSDESNDSSSSAKSNDD